MLTPTMKCVPKHCWWCDNNGVYQSKLSQQHMHPALWTKSILQWQIRPCLKELKVALASPLKVSKKTMMLACTKMRLLILPKSPLGPYQYSTSNFDYVLKRSWKRYWAIQILDWSQSDARIYASSDLCLLRKGVYQNPLVQVAKMVLELPLEAFCFNKKILKEERRVLQNQWWMSQARFFSLRTATQRLVIVSFL